MSIRFEQIEKAEARGLRVVHQIVREWWMCRFQEFEARNDDGIDGMIMLKKKGVVTGEIIHCQIKSGKGYKKEYSSHIGVNLGIKYIETHRARWNTIFEPTILIFVDEPIDKVTMPKAWWVNLKSDDAYSDKARSIIMIPKTQRFGDHSIGDIKKLCGTRHFDYKLQQIIIKRKDVTLFNLKENLKSQARRFYKDWADENITTSFERTNQALGEIIISRVGWKHLTRKGRKVERIIQSFHLLGVAKRMIKEVVEPELFGHPKYKQENGIGIFQDYIGLRAFAIFPHRYESSITVVLKRERKVNETNGKELERKIWFYSIYESRRGRTKNLDKK
jgi:hypothetical protein